MDITAEIIRLRLLIHQLVFKGSALELELQDREAYFKDGKEDWRNSEKGISYQEKTKTLGKLFENLSDEIETIEACTSRLEKLTN